MKAMLKGLLNRLRRWKQKLCFQVDWLRGQRTPWCGYLGTSVYIDPEGKVFSCCNYGPALLGNLHDQSIEEIWNGDELKRQRKLNRSGRLRCAIGCRQLRYAEDLPENDSRRRCLDVPADRLKWMFVEFGRRCNIACIMCNQDHGDRTELDWQLLRDKVDHSNLEMVSFQGGEPLLIGSARKYLDWVSGKVGRIHVLTNGTVMPRALSETLMAGENRVFISINGATKATHELVNRGSKWERVMRTIGMLRAARDASASAATITGHMTIVPENIHEIPLFIESVGLWGCDRADFCYDVQTVPALLRGDRELTDRLKREIVEAMEKAEGTADIDASQLELIGLAEAEAQA